MSTIAFIGIGRMGWHMAAHLAKAVALHCCYIGMRWALRPRTRHKREFRPDLV
jgi:3-hydroxyisobutyrate dehydrogenase-like beta-hydroxyacid dehydrogenase